MKKLALFFTFLFCLSAVAQDTYLYCGKLIDTHTGKVKNKMTVIVSGNKIKDVKKRIYATGVRKR